jgi:excisionase family DNA binding protein
MRFVKEQKTENVTRDNPAPKTSTERPTPRLEDGLTDIDGVASALGVSRRYVQSLVKRKVIPVIRLGRRCTRFDLARVLAAVKRYEVIEMGRK